ncbi:cytochrome c-type biogenesis protein CcmH [Brucella melitensis]|nr:cytochrome c-type biogenesis protein CcmH [Brucella melitensis]
MKKNNLFRALLISATFALQATAAFAVNPDEVLSDPKLEKRAREISAELRCMVCQNDLSMIPMRSLRAICAFWCVNA